MKNQDEVKAILRRVQNSDRRSRSPEAYAAELRHQVDSFAQEMKERARKMPLPHDADAGLKDMFGRFDYHIKKILWGMAIEVASSDGPINDHEGRLLSAAFDQDLPANAYRSVTKPSGEVIRDAFESILNGILHVNLLHSGNEDEYEPLHDPVFSVLDIIGDGIMNADESVNLREAASFADYTNIAHRCAMSLKQRMHETAEVEERTAPVPLADRKDQATPEGLTPLEACVRELHSLVGLSSVKKEVETLINVAKIFAQRRERKMPIPPLSFHLVLTGNPGTGKTTVARLISKIYSALGHLSTDKFIEVDRSGLVGNYVGQTANKTKRVVDSAIGGVLFIDEAYSLARSYENDFGSEAIEVILKAMEDHRSDLVVIVAGYADRMEKFISSNPGLKSRFSRTIDFHDYTAEEMLIIFEMLAKRNGYILDEDSVAFLRNAMEERWAKRGADFANARDVRSMFERAVSAQANRIATMETFDENALETFTREDLANY